MGASESSYLIRNKPPGVASPRDLLTLLSIAYQGNAYGECRALARARDSARQSRRTFASALANLVANGVVERDGDIVVIPALRAQTSRPGFVYVLACEGRYKLGASRNVRQRLRTLQTASPAPLELVWSADVPDMYGTERALHAQFAHRHIAGEWYALTPEDLQEIAGYQPG
jgi:hypothetical protein